MLTREQLGLQILAVLEFDRKRRDELVNETGFSRGQIQRGVEWIRDYDPNALVVQREGRRYFYKLAENADEVSEHISFRSKSLYRMALRLERMTANALVMWPESKLLKIMNRHLSRMREDVEELKP
jgi:hypothetical protein